MIESVCRELQENRDVRANLIALKQELKENAGEIAGLREWEEAQGCLRSFLRHEDAKTRKNAAILLGMIKCQPALDLLWESYTTEKTLFVKGSYLEAMDKLEISAYEKKLRESYSQLCDLEVPEEEKKHYQAEIKAVELLLRHFDGVKKHRFSGYQADVEVLLTTLPQYREITASQVKRGRTSLVAAGVKVKTENLRELLEIRTYRELLFLLHGCGSMEAEPERIAEALMESDLMELLEELHDGEAPFYFRLELKSRMEEKEKGIFLRRVAAAIEMSSKRTLQNSTDGYEIELRLIQNRDGLLFPCVKLYTLPMKRFAYRKEVVAASIQPSQAALLMRLAKPYLVEGAQVLDPFCGVGTMLIERDLLVPAGDMYATDIYGDAIKKGRENARTAGRLINFINRDIFDFTHKYLFDEIVTNMPVRGRKTKEEQDQFYARFFDKAATLLQKDGIIIMYSNEAGFVKKQLRVRKEYRLKNEYCIREKAGFYLFIISYKG